MVRKIRETDREIYLEMVKKFYNSDAVLHNVNEQNFVNTFNELMRSDEYTECYFLETENTVAGYALLSKTFSQEAGGSVYWIEEIFVLPEFRSKGLGKEFFPFLNNRLPPNVKRLRLEVEKDNSRAAALYKRLGYKELAYEQMYKEN